MGGRALNCRDRAALDQVEALLELMKFTKIQIDCFSMSAPQIFSRYERENLFLCGYEVGEPPKSFEEFLSVVKIKNREAERIFSDFSKGFGMGYREEQLKECEYHIGLLEELKQRLRDELKDKQKLNTTLCVSGALAVIILLI